MFAFARFSVLISFYLVAMAAFAEKAPALKVEGASFRPFPIAVTDLQVVANAPKLARTGADMMAVVRNDLALLGIFEVLPTSSFIADNGQDFAASKMNMQEWSQIGAEGLVRGALKLEGKSLQASIYVYQVGVLAKYESFEVKGDVDALRKMGHQIANGVYQFFTGEKGPFAHKIVVQQQIGKDKHLVVLDIDGKGKKQLTKGSGIYMLPAVSPDGSKVLYTTYKNNSPALLEMGIDGTNVRTVSSYKGLNLDGRYSPGGDEIVVTLSKGGNPELYLLSLDGKIQKQLTATGGINTSATWFPDGKRLAFVSNRAGNPHIYIRHADGSVRRLTFQGKYNQQPNVSPDGKQIVMTARDEENVFDIFIIDVESGKISRVTQNQGRNEDPIFLANGRNILFVSDRSGKKNLYISTLDGKQQIQVTSDGGYASPSL